MKLCPCSERNVTVSIKTSMLDSLNNFAYDL